MPGTNVLVVDDEPSVLESLRKLLVAAGYEVQVAENGVVALTQFQANPARVVILDLVMPEKEGLETLRELRRFDPAPKIIAMSGGGYANAETYLQMAGCLGADATLAKPFSKTELLTTLEGLLT